MTMPRPQFSLKSLLWLMALVGMVCVAWQEMKPTFVTRAGMIGDAWTTYEWNNGLSVTVTRHWWSGGTTIEIRKDPHIPWFNAAQESTE